LEDQYLMTGSFVGVDGRAKSRRASPATRVARPTGRERLWKVSTLIIFGPAGGLHYVL
jgi:hypothetical protein